VRTFVERAHCRVVRPPSRSVDPTGARALRYGVRPCWRNGPSVYWHQAEDRFPSWRPARAADARPRCVMPSRAHGAGLLRGDPAVVRLRTDGCSLPFVLLAGDAMRCLNACRPRLSIRGKRLPPSPPIRRHRWLGSLMTSARRFRSFRYTCVAEYWPACAGCVRTSLTWPRVVAGSADPAWHGRP